MRRGVATCGRLVVAWWFGCIFPYENDALVSDSLPCGLRVARPTRLLLSSRPVPETQTQVGEVDGSSSCSPKAPVHGLAHAAHARARPSQLRARAPNRTRRGSPPQPHHGPQRAPPAAPRRPPPRQRPWPTARQRPRRARPRPPPPWASRSTAGARRRRARARAPAAARGGAPAAPPAAVAADSGGSATGARGRSGAAALTAAAATWAGEQVRPTEGTPQADTRTGRTSGGDATQKETVPDRGALGRLPRRRNRRCSCISRATNATDTGRLHRRPHCRHRPHPCRRVCYRWRATHTRGRAGPAPTPTPKRSRPVEHPDPRWAAPPAPPSAPGAAAPTSAPVTGAATLAATAGTPAISAAATAAAATAAASPLRADGHVELLVGRLLGRKRRVGGGLALRPTPRAVHGTAVAVRGADRKGRCVGGSAGGHRPFGVHRPRRSPVATLVRPAVGERISQRKTGRRRFFQGKKNNERTGVRGAPPQQRGRVDASVLRT